MSSSVDRLPHTGRLSALLRLLPFARPYRGLLVLTFTGALLASLAQLVVPLLTAAVVDGPLLSRAFTDISTIRRFVGFVAVFLAVNLLMCAVVLVLLLVTYWPLGLAVLLTTVPLTAVGLRWERRYNQQS